MKGVFFYFLVAMLVLTSCGAIKKAMHPNQYCDMKGCHLKHNENSSYCAANYVYVMSDIMGKATKLKMDNKKVEEGKNSTSNQ